MIIVLSNQRSNQLGYFQGCMGAFGAVGLVIWHFSQFWTVFSTSKPGHQMKQRAKLFILRHVVVIKRYYDLLGGIITHPHKMWKSGLWDKISKLIFCITWIEYLISSRMIYDTSQSHKRQSYSGGLNHCSHKSFILNKTFFRSG